MLPRHSPENGLLMAFGIEVIRQRWASVRSHVAAVWCPSMMPEGSHYHCFDTFLSSFLGVRCFRRLPYRRLSIDSRWGVWCVKHMAENVVHMPGVNANVAMRQLSSPGRVPWPKVSEPLGPLDVPIWRILQQKLLIFTLQATLIFTSCLNASVRDCRKRGVQAAILQWLKPAIAKFRET